MVVQNLTKLILLGILFDFPKPIHGYEIKRVINQWAIGEFAEISYGSLYYNLGKMEIDQLIIGKTAKTGDRPEKRLYSITKKGRDDFIKMLRNVYFEIQDIRYPFDIGILFMPALSKQEVLEGFDKRIKEINKFEKMHLRLIKKIKEKIPFFSLYIIKHHLYHWSAEKEWLIDLKREVEKRNTFEEEIEL